jgi:hypothetical protein
MTYSPSLFHLAKHLSPDFHFICLQITILLTELSSLVSSFGKSEVSPINSCVNLITSIKSTFSLNNSSFSGSFLRASSA